MRLTWEPVFVPVPLHYAGFCCKVDVCCAWNRRQFLQKLHSTAVKPTVYLYPSYKVKSDTSIYSTSNCCSKPEHFACGSSFCMSVMIAPSSWATTAVFPQRRLSLRASWMKAYWSYGRIMKPLMTEMYYTHYDGNAQRILLAYVYTWLCESFRRISNLTGT